MEKSYLMHVCLQLKCACCSCTLNKMRLACMINHTQTAMKAAHTPESYYAYVGTYGG